MGVFQQMHRVFLVLLTSIGLSSPAFSAQLNHISVVQQQPLI